MDLIIIVISWIWLDRLVRILYPAPVGR